MAKAPAAALGIEIGEDWLKIVRLQRSRGGRITITHHSSQSFEEADRGGEAFQSRVSAVLKKVGASAKVCGVCCSSSENFLKIIEQPETPTEILRQALRLNGMALLNQRVSGVVVDCKQLRSDGASGHSGAAARSKYLVGGAPRAQIASINAGLAACGVTLKAIQPSAICAFNAFQVAKPQSVAGEAFLIVNVGPMVSTFVGGSRGNILLTRTINFGSHGLLTTLCELSGHSPETLIDALDRDGELDGFLKAAIHTFVVDMESSIHYLEENHECRIERVFVSGGPAESPVFRGLVSQELGVPCEAWSFADSCAIEMSSAEKADFERQSSDLNAACGAAFEVIDHTASSIVRLDLLHELEQVKKIRRRDPLRFAGVAIGVIALGFAANYLYQRNELRRLKEENARLETMAARAEIEASVARKREEELSGVAKTSERLVDRIEGRFYWAPVLGIFARTVPREVQMLNMSGFRTTDPGRAVRITVDAIAAGEEPRKIADGFRKAMEQELSSKYRKVTAVFSSLEDSETAPILDGKPLHAVSFSIAFHFETGAAPVTPPPVFKGRQKRP